MQHSDFDIFCNAVYIMGGDLVHHDFSRDFKLPNGVCGVVEVPKLDIYECVDVYFEVYPSQSVLNELRFPRPRNV